MLWAPTKLDTIDNQLLLFMFDFCCALWHIWFPIYCLLLQHILDNFHWAQLEAMQYGLHNYYYYAFLLLLFVSSCLGGWSEQYGNLVFLFVYCSCYCCIPPPPTHPHQHQPFWRGGGGGDTFINSGLKMCNFWVIIKIKIQRLVSS